MEYTYFGLRLTWSIVEWLIILIDHASGSTHFIHVVVDPITYVYRGEELPLAPKTYLWQLSAVQLPDWYKLLLIIQKELYIFYLVLQPINRQWLCNWFNQVTSFKLNRPLTLNIIKSNFSKRECVCHWSFILSFLAQICQICCGPLQFILLS